MQVTCSAYDEDRIVVVPTATDGPTDGGGLGKGADDDDDDDDDDSNGGKNSGQCAIPQNQDEWSGLSIDKMAQYTFLINREDLK